MRNLIALFVMCVSVTAFSQSSSITLQNGKYTNMDGVAHTGICEQFENGLKISELTVIEGVLSGEATYFHDNGSVKEVGSFENGNRSGTWIGYSNEGEKVSTASFNNDKKHGKWLVWDESGAKRFEMYYDNGAKVGTWKMWDSEGKLSTKTY